MVADVGQPAGETLTFGPFRLAVGGRILERDGHPVPLGGRALDLLIVLADNANRLIGKRELLRLVWPDATVDEGSLRFHVAALRRALGDGEAGARYIDTLPGRGYCFVAPVRRIASLAAAPAAHNLPARRERLVGRDGALRLVATAVAAERFVTVVGPGGVGKTTLAVAVGHELLEWFGGAVHLVDLGPVNDASLIAGAIASALGLPVRTADPVADVAAFLRDRRMLLILDGCEHLVETAAVLAERVHAEAPGAYILATSREPLRAEGERVYHLPPLEAPPDQSGLTAAEALAFPAVQLFVDRAAAASGDFTLADEDAPAAAAICRGLDGVPLAIEFAAGRVGAYGARETARLLDSRLRLLWPGRRTAPPRHRTLAAALDWSHDLLAEPERAVLRRLATFAGPFGLEAVRAVAADGELDDALVLDVLAGLVAKSLVAVDHSGPAPRYRLLDTTRTYVGQKLIESGERDRIAWRHAAHFRESLERAAIALAGLSEVEVSAAWGDHVGNARAALEWCFTEHGDTELGTALAAAAAPLFLKLSLLAECRGWAERAIAVLDESARGTRREMELQAALGQSLMFTRGNVGEVLAAYERGLVIAEATGCLERQVQLLGWLQIFHLRTGNYRAAFDWAPRNAAAAAQLGHPAAIAAARSFLGVSCHLMGCNEQARAHLMAALAPQHASPASASLHIDIDHRTHARIALARTLWLQGLPDQAAVEAARTVAEAARLGRPTTLCIALLYTAAIDLWIGELSGLAERIDEVIALATRHSLGPYQPASLGVQGELTLRSGRHQEGVATIRGALEALHRDRYELLTSPLTCALAEGLTALGRHGEALSEIDAAIRQAECGGDLYAMPEMLHVKGKAIDASHHADAREATIVLTQALELARSQGALSWELRVATSLARLELREGRRGDAQARLAAIYGRFTEGFGSADLRSARATLDV